MKNYLNNLTSNANRRFIDLSYVNKQSLQPSITNPILKAIESMATQTNAPKTPSKNIEEFLQRHPQVRTGAAAKADLDHLHEHGDTFCVINKLFDNALLHKDYDPDSLKLILAFAYVNDEQAMANHADDAEEGDSVLCDCEVGREEGPDHHLHEFVRATVPDCEVHREGEPDPGCGDCWPVYCGSNCRGVEGFE